MEKLLQKEKYLNKMINFVITRKNLAKEGNQKLLIVFFQKKFNKKDSFNYLVLLKKESTNFRTLQQVEIFTELPLLKDNMMPYFLHYLIIL